MGQGHWRVWRTLHQIERRAAYLAPCLPLDPMQQRHRRRVVLGHAHLLRFVHQTEVEPEHEGGGGGGGGGGRLLSVTNAVEPEHEGGGGGGGYCRLQMPLSLSTREGSRWSGCSVRIRVWLRLPHGCHRLLSIVSASRASPGDFR